MKNYVNVPNVGRETLEDACKTYRQWEIHAEDMWEQERYSDNNRMRLLLESLRKEIRFSIRSATRISLAEKALVSQFIGDIIPFRLSKGPKVHDVATRDLRDFLTQ